jgi:rhodanese-related sulfurtransferase
MGVILGVAVLLDAFLVKLLLPVLLRLLGTPPVAASRSRARQIGPLSARVQIDREGHPGRGLGPLLHGQLTLVDVRTEQEFEQVRVPGVLHIPVTEIKGRLGEIPAEHPVAFLCRSGHRSSLAARMAARHRDDVMNVAGGMDAWLDAGLPSATCPVSHEHASTRPPTGTVPETRKTRNR